MRERDYLWCLAHMVLDREEALERLCPVCRTQAEEELCPVCGRPAGRQDDGEINTGFDWKRYEQLKGGQAD